jgi:uncharacterized protein (TIGR02598 family)
MKKRSQAIQGFSLVEVALALGIAAFCLVTLLALMPVGLQSYKKADDQSVMVNLATMVVRDIQSAPSGASPSPRFLFKVPAAGGPSDVTPQTIYVNASGVETGAIGTAPTQDSLYRINVAFFPPASGKTATTARIQITSPALADANPGAWPTKYSNMFETVVALNRN